MTTNPETQAEFHIVFFDNNDLNQELLPQTKIALFAKKIGEKHGNIDPNRYQVYYSPYLIQIGTIIKDVIAKKNMQVLINSFYNYLKPARYDMLVLDKAKIIHTFSSIEEFFYDILYPEDKSKTRPLEKTPLRDPGLLGSTQSNTQFIRENPANGAEAASKINTNLDVGIQVVHFERVYSIHDKLNNIIIPEEKAIQAIKEDPNLKQFIIKVDLRKYCISAKEDLALQYGRIYSLRGHYLVGHTYYNSPSIETATYLIMDRPMVINTMELCTNRKLSQLLARNFINTGSKMDDKDVLSLVYPQIQGQHLISFLNLSTDLALPYLNKSYVLIDKTCVQDDSSTARILHPRKFIANMYEATYFMDITSRQ